MFKHIIMTRFNLATPGKESQIRTQVGWLEGRFHLFETYCLPSIAAQRNMSFDWIIYFDVDTPDIFKARISKLQKIFPFHAYYTPLFRSEGWSRSLRETYPLTQKFLLTTRLDNDDALAIDYTERLHQSVRDNAFELGAYNFRNGLICEAGALYKIDHPKNAFFSWLDLSAGDLRPAPSIQHMRLDDFGPVHQIEGAPGWLQVVHETNVSNKTRGNRVMPECFLPLFPDQITNTFSRTSLSSIVIQNTLQAPLWSLRDKINDLASKSLFRKK